jgi:large subunit ribosomal protein L4
MPSIAVYNMNKQQVGEVQPSDDVFDVEVRESLIHQALRIQLANGELNCCSQELF